MDVHEGFLSDLISVIGIVGERQCPSKNPGMKLDDELCKCCGISAAGALDRSAQGAAPVSRRQVG